MSQNNIDSPQFNKVYGRHMGGEVLLQPGSGLRLCQNFNNMSMAEKNIVRKAARYLRQTVKSQGLTKPSV